VIIDTSALVAILADEDDAAVYASAIVATAPRTISAANYLECAIVLDNRLNPLSGRGFDQFLLESGIAITSVTPELARIARMAYRDFGRGSGHPARLNFGDCFAYALAIESNQPLLYKGDDFRHTDVRSALEPAR
jgi:ribonuclease VapC